MKAHIFLSLLVVSIVIGFVNATAQQPDRGFRSANTYAASGLDAVNMANGNLVFNIPIASLPAGRGGSPGFSVNLQYNSKLWESNESIQDHGVPDENGGTKYSVSRLALSDSGGWRLASGYNIKVTDRLAFEMPDPCWLGDPVEHLMFRWKVELELPDGSIRPLFPRISNGVLPIMSDDGFAAVDPSGKYYQAQRTTDPATNACMVVDNSYQLTTNGMTYITLDGSRIRVFMPHQSSNWTAYMPDGTIIENAPPDTPGVGQRVTDRNGNRIESRPDNICDQLGRCIAFRTDENSNTIVSVKGVGGETLSTRIEWGGRWIQRRYRITTAQNAPWFLAFETICANAPTVKKIVFPTQLGSQEMQFDYFGSEQQPTTTAETEGWGELKSVTLPTGASAHFEYGELGDTSADVLARGAFAKRLEYQEQNSGEAPLSHADVWKYEASNWGGSVTEPSGAFTSESKHYNINLGLWTNGLVFSSRNPDSVVERIWGHNIPFTLPGGGTNPPGSFVGAGSANAYVKTEFTTPRSLDGSINNSSPTAIKDFKYDKNGNVLEIAEYDWVPYGSIPRSGGVPTGLPASGFVLLRKTVNTYYNQAANADSTVADSNSYSDPTSPRLKNLIKSTEIRDGNNTPTSRTEFYYDDPNTRGNLIETRSWDSSKGAISDPLSTSNSIRILSQYDQYGNVIKTTDGRGVETTITYGDVSGPSGTFNGIYPTQTIAASNYASVRRTSSATYDLSTGLVTSATDVDNNVTSVTEYDALGRPTRIRSAVSTPSESWTRTEYDDTNRRVIVRSDIDSVGDGRKVVTQFFDQLGRVRLTKTLEDASMQSPVNETDGIKVETRYGYNDPTPSDSSDPQNTLGIYTATSNPFRAVNASAASGEQTMGWSRSYSARNGLTSENETFTGSGLPAPWGTNAISSGVVKTEADKTATTVVDQAGKKKRNVSDALGRLVRVDEPNGAGDLGAVNSPTQSTSYLYNALGKLVHVQQGIQTRYFMYDSLGRLIRARQPEQQTNVTLNTAGNPSNNSWTAGFTYDNSSNLIGSVDANNVTISSTYDALNRPVVRSYSDLTPQVTFGYDAPSVQYAKGKSTSVTSSVSETRVTAFDAVGRVTGSQQKTDGREYDSTHKYNLDGVLIEQTYPSRRVATSFTESDGQLSSVASKVAGGQFRNYATNFSYTPSGAIRQVQLGNGLWESAQLNARLQVTELSVGPLNGASVWRLGYQYGTLDANGNVDATKNNGDVAKHTTISAGQSGPFTQSFAYDSLDRIVDAREVSGVTQTWRQTFGYDRYGNRTSRSENIGGQQLVLNNLTLPTIDPNTNRFADGQGYSYDATGNLTHDPRGWDFVFNGDNKQVEVRDSQGGSIGKYLYDGSGRRVKKITVSEITVFVYDGVGKLIAEMSTAAQPQEPTVSYTATDTLGSPRLLTNKQGQIISRRDFMPFGEELPTDPTYRTASLKYGAGDNVRQKFTGYQRDNETGLDFAEARYYNQTHGRFTAVDPLLASGKSADPQTFNRYVYALNRPITLTDQTGMQCGKAPDEEGDYQPEVITDDRQIVKAETVVISPKRETDVAVAVGKALNAGYEKEQGLIKISLQKASNEATKAAISDFANTFDPEVTVGAAPTGPSASVTIKLPSPVRMVEAFFLSTVSNAGELLANRIQTEGAVNTVLLNANIEYQAAEVKVCLITESLVKSTERGIKMHQKATGSTPRFDATTKK